MAKFESSLGSKTFAGQQLSEFDVPDETEEHTYNYGAPAPRRSPSNTDASSLNSAREFQNRMQNEDPEDTAELERQVREARDQKRTGKERLNDGAKRRIEMLVGMTRTSREVMLDGNSFILQTLKSKDMREALTTASEFDGTVHSPFEIRRQLLGRALVQIAGVEASQFVGSTNLEAKLNFIDEQIEAVLNRLYAEYLQMVNESNNKYAIVTETDAKEVVEDLKK